VHGAPLTRFSARAKAFAYLPDQGELPGELSGYALVRHALRHATGEADAEQLRQLLSVEPLLEVGAGVLSRGERRRLQLFTTLALGRPVVVLDEPFSSIVTTGLEHCEAQHRRRPSFVAVDFSRVGDAQGATQVMNGVRAP
jgi:ABC-type multidrug transport system ATPase subunit